MRIAAAVPGPLPAFTRVDGHLHLAALDGWRGISILTVLAAHMLPLGPAWLKLNEAAGLLGMALFFTLSGFLITRSLLRDDAAVPFLIKRLFRIVPLAWVYILLVIAPVATPHVTVANLLFVANASQDLLRYSPHFWSLSVEMQFYVFVAALVALGGRRSLNLLPLLAIAVTIGRMARGETVGVHTLDRIDEILAGATLALLVRRNMMPSWRTGPPIVIALLTLLLVGSQEEVRSHVPVLAYIRPYLAAAAVGLSLTGGTDATRRILGDRRLAYVARISYALYVIHPLTYAGWLGSGDRLERYLKRPVCFAIAFGFAHLSTNAFESPINRAGQRLAASRRRPVLPKPAA